jgi:hypothetical protein
MKMYKYIETVKFPFGIAVSSCTSHTHSFVENHPFGGTVRQIITLIGICSDYCPLKGRVHRENLI